MMDKCEMIETVIVGAGISGLCMAMKLMMSGRTSSFIILEKSAGIGGVWSSNRYPGCACDMPSHLYSFSFHRDPSAWSSLYATRAEIHSYLADCARVRGVLPHVRFHTEALSATWDDRAAMWRIRAAHRRHDQDQDKDHDHEQDQDHDHDQDQDQDHGFFEIHARFLVRAIGPWHMPKFPDKALVPGIELFAGPSFHSSAWDPSIDLRGRVVAVVGTGASAVQIAPEVAPIARKLYICQRTPAWVLPKLEARIPTAAQRVLRRFPTLLCGLLWWTFLFVVELYLWALLGGPRRRRMGAMLAKRHLYRSIRDPTLRAALLPTYEFGNFGCRRFLTSSTFYPTLSRPNVELLPGGLREVRPHSIVVKDQSQGVDVEKDVDVIIYATGFDIHYPNFDIVGLNGIHLKHASSDSLLGVTKHGFPNLFMILNPYNGLVLTSLTLVAEIQASYILSCMSLLNPTDKFQPRSLEPRETSQQQFHDRLTKKTWKTCHTTPLNKPIFWTFSTIDYIFDACFASPSDYIIK